MRKFDEERDQALEKFILAASSLLLITAGVCIAIIAGERIWEGLL